MKRVAMAGAMLALIVSAAARADEKTLKDLEGTYKVLALTKAGVDVSEEDRNKVTVKFKGDEMSLVLPNRTLTAKIKVNSEKSPKTIEISPVDGPEKGRTFPGIFKAEKDELVLAFAEKGDRPADFKAEGETVLMKLKKEKEKE